MDYVKNFQDFYIHSKHKYHAIDDILYYQKCEKATKIWIPETIETCSRDIPCTFIDTVGNNRTGYLTEYELIRTVQPEIAKRLNVKNCDGQILRYSLPDDKHQLLRNGNEIQIFKMSRLGRAFRLIDTIF